SRGGRHLRRSGNAGGDSSAGGRSRRRGTAALDRKSAGPGGNLLLAERQGRRNRVPAPFRHHFQGRPGGVENPSANPFPGESSGSAGAQGSAGTGAGGGGKSDGITTS